MIIAARRRTLCEVEKREFSPFVLIYLEGQKAIARYQLVSQVILNFMEKIKDHLETSTRRNHKISHNQTSFSICCGLCSAHFCPWPSGC